MKKTILIMGTFILLCVPLLMYAAQNDQARHAVSDVLERQITVTKGEYPTTHSSFVESLVSTHVPGGVISILSCDNKHPRQQTLLSPGTLRETLDTIVKTNPEYRWRVDNGVINLLPAQGEPDLLKVRISRLRVENARSINTILNELLDLPEVKGAIAKLRLNTGVKIIVGPTWMDPEKRPKYNLECENMTVREALNAIARTHGRAVWEYQEQHCDDKTVYSVDFIVE